MKNFKKTFYLLMVAGFMVSCQQEEILLNENSQLKTLDTNVNKEESSKSILEIVASGVDLDSYFKSLQKIKGIENRNTVYESDDMTVVQFFYSAEDFECTSLPTQNFEASNYSSGISAPIDQYTNTIHFSPGDILPGISFDQTNYTSGAFFIPSNSYGYPNVLMSNFYDGDLVLNFTNDNVYDVSMKLYNLATLANSIMYVSVYDSNENYLGQASVNYSHPGDRSEGVFLGLHSELSISKIIISSAYTFGYEGIDEVSFGNCNDPDLDGDGILNEDDPYPSSNMSEMLYIGENYLDIENKFVEDGTTMMDQIDTLIEGINEKYDGSNWDELHRTFIRELSKITYYWYKNRLISRRDRVNISRAVNSTNIPYWNGTI